MDLQTSPTEKRFLGGLSRWGNRFLDLVFPRNCPLCNRALAEDDPGCICPPCFLAFKRIHPPMCRWCGRPVRGEVLDEFVCSQCRGRKLHYDRAISACMADTKMLDAIHRFKYQREIYFGPQLAQLVIECGRTHVEWTRIDAIVPIPLHPAKERYRQFNQARILAEAVSEEFSVPMVDRNLRRLIDTPSQTFLNAADRQKNLRDAFIVRRPADFEGKWVVLLDDVYTTGSTSNACAKELKKAGAEKVLVLTLARAF